MTQPVLAAGARTPIGKLLGSLSGLAAPALGGTAIRAALDRAGVAADQVDAVMMGNVVQAGVGPNRRGFKYGATQLTDALDQDALVCGFDGISMCAATERYQAGPGISRQDQDDFAAESHARAAAAIKDGRLAEEIVPVSGSGRTGEGGVETMGMETGPARGAR
jgi:acetyl-CoA C-acetyltransferase